MIEGDEGKPMSIMEFISDEPCEAEAYIDYQLKNQRAHREYWHSLPNDRDPDKATARECVLTHLDGFIFTLEDIKAKMNRPR